MNESTTSNTSHCDQCAVPLTESNHGFFAWRDRCDRCHSRLELDDDLLEIAYVANQFYKSDDQVINLQHDLAVTRLRVQELKKPVEADDSRAYHLWEKLYRALNGDIEQDETWDLIMSEIPGVPDFRTKRYGGVVTLKFYFSDIEVSGDVDSYEIESAILEEIRGDLQYGYEDECEVDYEEE